jgi:hypothetical protein
MMYEQALGSLIHSTIWREPDHVRLVWIAMIAMANSDQIVEASIPGLADVARVSVDRCEQALERLQAPDSYNVHGDQDGRSVAAVDGGWRILGQAAGRLSAAERRAKAAERQRERRARLKAEAQPTAEQIETWDRVVP